MSLSSTECPSEYNNIPICIHIIVDKSIHRPASEHTSMRILCHPLSLLFCIDDVADAGGEAADEVRGGGEATAGKGEEDGRVREMEESAEAQLRHRQKIRVH